jgi:Uma2 family endonuclease
MSSLKTPTKRASQTIGIARNGTHSVNGASGTGSRRKFVPRDALLTVEQWAVMPDTKPRYELVEGRLVQKMTTNTGHAWAAGRLLIEFSQWGDDWGWRFLPEGTGVKLGEFGGSVPDVVGYAPNQKLDAKANYNERPFLVVEVLSKRTAKRDRTRKKSGYSAISVQLYLIVDTEARIVEVYTLHDGAYGEPQVLKENDVWQPQNLPGLRLEVARLWL